MCRNYFSLIITSHSSQYNTVQNFHSKEHDQSHFRSSTPLPASPNKLSSIGFLNPWKSPYILTRYIFCIKTSPSYMVSESYIIEFKYYGNGINHPTHSLLVHVCFSRQVSYEMATNIQVEDCFTASDPPTQESSQPPKGKQRS